MKLQATITKLKVTLLVALSFFSSIGFSQNFNEFFRFHQTDKSVIATGIMPINDTLAFGISSQLDSTSNINFNIFSFDLFTKTVTSNRKIVNNQGEFRYIQTLPPQIDFLGRVCHAFSNDKQSEGRNGEFIIYNPQTRELIDSIYKTPKKSGFASFIQKPDSTFLLFGTSTEFDPNGDFYVMHVGKNGEFISDTTYGHPFYEERGYAIAATPDGGYVFTGMRRTTLNSNITFRSKIAVFKIDANGAVEWSNLYGSDLYNVPYQIKVAEDSSIYVVGLGSTIEITENSFDNSPSILKLSKEGNNIWGSLLTLPPDSTNTFYQRGEATNLLFDESNNEFYLSGFYNIFRERNLIPTNPAFIMKYDTSGREIWRRYIYNETFTQQNSSTVYQLYSIEKTFDGGFIMGGTINGKAPDPVGQYGWIVKTDSLGCVVPGCHLVGVENNKGQIANKLLVYPNPSNNSQGNWLSFALPKAEAVSIEILNLNGQMLKAQNFGILPQGNHQIQIDLTLESGIYFIKLQSETINETLKWVLE